MLLLWGGGGKKGSRDVGRANGRLDTWRPVQTTFVYRCGCSNGVKFDLVSFFFCSRGDFSDIGRDFCVCVVSGVWNFFF